MKSFTACVLALFYLTAVAVQAGAPAGDRVPSHWIASWGTAQQLAPPSVPPWVRRPAQPDSANGAPENRPPAQPSVFPDRLVAQTVRMVIRSTVAGRAVRVSLSNSFGLAPVRIDAAQIARFDGNASIHPGSSHALTFGGREFVVLAPGAQICSDPVQLAVRAQEDLAVSLYVGGDSGAPTAHSLGLRTAYVAAGNQAASPTLQSATQFRSYLWLSGLEVLGSRDTATIVAFGDSITDGYSTTPGADASWPSVLARRLAADRSVPPRAVINMGISGNRVLREGAGSSALARFDRDVLARPGARWVILIEGINDISFNAFPGLPESEIASAADIIAGYRQLTQRARMHGLQVIGGTLMPFEGVPTYSEAGERIRQEVNRWIRESGEFDTVVDFDAVTRDPAKPSRLRASFDAGDHIHPNDEGNRAMAEAVPLLRFR